MRKCRQEKAQDVDLIWINFEITGMFNVHVLGAHEHGMPNFFATLWLQKKGRRPLANEIQAYLISPLTSEGETLRGDA